MLGDVVPKRGSGACSAAAAGVTNGLHPMWAKMIYESVRLVRCGARGSRYAGFVAISGTAQQSMTCQPRPFRIASSASVKASFLMAMQSRCDGRVMAT
jgi:hypothetical protein